MGSSRLRRLLVPALLPPLFFSFSICFMMRSCSAMISGERLLMKASSAMEAAVLGSVLGESMVVIVVIWSCSCCEFVANLLLMFLFRSFASFSDLWRLFCCPRKVEEFVKNSHTFWPMTNPVEVHWYEVIQDLRMRLLCQWQLVPAYHARRMNCWQSGLGLSYFLPRATNGRFRSWWDSIGRLHKHVSTRFWAFPLARLKSNGEYPPVSVRHTSLWQKMHDRHRKISSFRDRGSHLWWKSSLPKGKKKILLYSNQDLWCKIELIITSTMQKICKLC